MLTNSVPQFTLNVKERLIFMMWNFLHLFPEMSVSIKNVNNEGDVPLRLLFQMYFFLKAFLKVLKWEAFS